MPEEVPIDDDLLPLPNASPCTNRELAARLHLVRVDLFGRGGSDHMARSIGVPGRTWTNIEAGVAILAPTLLRFLAITRVEPGWLLTGTGSRYRDEPGPARPTVTILREGG